MVMMNGISGLQEVTVVTLETTTVTSSLDRMDIFLITKTIGTTGLEVFSTTLTKTSITRTLYLARPRQLGQTESAKP